MPPLPPITTTSARAAPAHAGWGRCRLRWSWFLRRWRSRPDPLARGRDLRVERLERGDVDLRERRERLDRVAQDVEGHAGADGERGLLEPFAGLGAEGVCAGQPLAV